MSQRQEGKPISGSAQPVSEVAMGLLIEAGAVLASSLDLTTTMGQVARLTVPRLADLCVIDLRDDDGSIKDVAVAAARDRLARDLEQLRARYPLDPAGGHPVARVISSGEPELLPEMTSTLLSSFAQGSEHARFMIDHDYHSAVVAPLLARGRTLGALSVLRLGDSVPYGSEDLDLVCELALRAALAIDNARLYTERTRIAHTLQQALLPESLPEIPGAEIEALYCAAGELNEVGGDFYDVFQQDANHWLLAIGDVCGKGPRAAGVTALARHTLRAAAISGQSPTEMLGTLHRALRHQPPGADLCTVCLVTIAHSPGHTRLTVTLAGHPPPLLISRSGEATQIGRPGTLLGVIDPIEIRESEAELHPGQTLLLYTDGVTEAGRPQRQLGEQGLLDLCRQAPRLALPALLEHIEHAALERAEGGLRDDIALLALRRVGPGS
jgi:serine phosphatase RsbU (regulator of sigma subunit)